MIHWFNFEDKITLNILKILVYEFSTIKRIELEKRNREYDISFIEI